MTIEMIDSSYWEDAETGEYYEKITDEATGDINYLYCGDEEISEERFCYLTQDITKKQLVSGNLTRNTWVNKEGECHRIDAPAITDIRNSDSKVLSEFWYKNGQVHRVDGPAIFNREKSQFWYQNGIMHRVGGPARIDKLNKKMYFCQGGVTHRLNGPAVCDFQGNAIEYAVHGKPMSEGEYAAYLDSLPYYLHVEFDGTEKFIDKDKGNLHRMDGPALIKPDGHQEWYYDNKLHREDGPAVIESNGTEYWYKHGSLHRDDGAPAVIHPNGTGEEWYRNGEMHRPFTDGPALAYYDDDGEVAYAEYAMDGNLHRMDGPAIIDYEDESGELKEEFFIYGCEISREEFESGSVQIEEEDGTSMYVQTGVPVLRYHREDGPAVIKPDGTEYWYMNGSLHRTDGPAVVYGNGVKEYFVNGVQIHPYKFKQVYGDDGTEPAIGTYDGVPPIESRPPKQSSEMGSLGQVAGAAAVVALISGFAKGRKKKSAQKINNEEEQEVRVPEPNLSRR